MKKLYDMLPMMIRQFISYFFVGGIAAIVEWLIFAFLSNVIRVDYILSTMIAFLVATAVNYILGKLWTFRKSKLYINKQKKEIIFVFGASGVGLLINICLMYILVSFLGLNTNILKLFSKILATGIVFFWNFFVRKFVIYREK